MASFGLEVIRGVFGMTEMWFRGWSGAQRSLGFVDYAPLQVGRGAAEPVAAPNCRHDKLKPFRNSLEQSYAGIGMLVPMQVSAP